MRIICIIFLISILIILSSNYFIILEVKGLHPILIIEEIILFIYYIFGQYCNYFIPHIIYLYLRLFYNKFGHYIMLSSSFLVTRHSWHSLSVYTISNNEWRKCLYDAYGRECQGRLRILKMIGFFLVSHVLVLHNHNMLLSLNLILYLVIF